MTPVVRGVLAAVGAITSAACSGPTTELRVAVSSSSVPAVAANVQAAATGWWFADGLGRDEYLDDELLPLLGDPSGELRDVAPARLDAAGWSFVNPLGERAPLLIRGPDGELFDDVDPKGVEWLILALHQTTMIGGAEPCGDVEGGPAAFGTVLADEFDTVVICPTSPFTGGRQPGAPWETDWFYQRHPRWSAIGREVAEVVWTIDALGAAGFPVDDVVVVGHSQGAIVGTVAAALDDRIGVLVASGGYVDADNDLEPDRWSRDGWYRAFPGAVAFDLLEPLAAIAPRSVLSIGYDSDDVFGDVIPPDAAREILGESGADFDLTLLSGEHGVAIETIETMSAWLRTHLPVQVDR
jgi:predicted esterase